MHADIGPPKHIINAVGGSDRLPQTGADTGNLSVLIRGQRPGLNRTQIAGALQGHMHLIRGHQRASATPRAQIAARHPGQRSGEMIFTLCVRYHLTHTQLQVTTACDLPGSCHRNL